MFVKIGTEDYECYINVRSIESFGRLRVNIGNQPMLAQSVSGRSSPQPMIPPGPSWEYWIVMKNNIGHSDGRMMLSEEDYNKIVKAMQSAGSEYLYGE